MDKTVLLERQDKYYQDVGKWFLSQLKKWSKKHNTHLKDYGILEIWTIGSDNVYEPYSNCVNGKLEEQFKEALEDYEELIEDLNDLGIKCWQGLEYSDKAKFIH